MTALLSIYFSVSTIASESNSFTGKIEETSITLGEIENLLFEYFDTNGLDYQLNSPEIVEYFTSVLLEDADENLSEHADYELIRHYAAEYLHELEKSQIEHYSGDNVSTIEASFINFNLDGIADKTIGEIKEEVIEEEKLIEAENKRFLEENGPVISPFTAYSGTAAASYAKKWAKSRNSLYINH